MCAVCILCLHAESVSVMRFLFLVMFVPCVLQCICIMYYVFVYMIVCILCVYAVSCAVRVVFPEAAGLVFARLL